MPLMRCLCVQGRLRHVPIPSNIWATPGHYSVIGLLPDDHTYAKGSLFIIKPGTKAVVFDVDGAAPFLMLMLGVIVHSLPRASHKDCVKNCLALWSVPGAEAAIPVLSTSSMVTVFVVLGSQTWTAGVA